MGMFDWIFGTRRDHDNLEFARRVAVESRAQVWQQIAVRAGRLGSLPERKLTFVCGPSESCVSS